MEIRFFLLVVLLTVGRTVMIEGADLFPVVVNEATDAPIERVFCSKLLVLPSDLSHTDDVAVPFVLLMLGDAVVPSGRYVERELILVPDEVDIRAPFVTPGTIDPIGAWLL